MKKTLKMVLCMTLVLGMLLSMAACDLGSIGGKASVAGRYDFVKMEMEGFSMDLETLKAMGGDELADIEMYLELKEDGTGVLAVMGESTDMQWADGQIWAVGEEDAKVPFTVENGVLTMEQDGMKMTFKK